jgi:predicted nucleic acid-binding protein
MQIRRANEERMTQTTGRSNTSVVVDTSVVVASVSPLEPRHAESRDFLQELHRRGVSLEAPSYFMLELYAVLNRSPRELRQLGFMTEKNPIILNFHSIGVAELEIILAWLSSAMPGRCPTRGADLAYAWVAKQRGIPLVTLDRGLHQFVDAGLKVHYPSDLLAIWRRVP